MQNNPFLVTIYLSLDLLKHEAWPMTRRRAPEWLVQRPLSSHRIRIKPNGGGSRLYRARMCRVNAISTGPGARAAARVLRSVLGE